MIIAERKDAARLIDMLEGRRSVLVAGCRACVAVCQAGGEREVASMAEALRLHATAGGLERSIETVTVERMPYFRWPAVSASRSCRILFRMFRCFPALTPAIWALPSNRASMRKGAAAAEIACSILRAGYARWPVAPNRCSMAHAAAPRTAGARSIPRPHAPGT